MKSILKALPLFLLLSNISIGALTPDDPSPPPGTPEMPSSLAPFIVAIAIGGAIYWRVSKKRKNKDKSDHEL